jgi:hypothetical protein
MNSEIWPTLVLGDQMIRKKSPNILKSSQNKPNNAKIQNLLLNTLFRWKCYELVAQDIDIFGAYCFNEPTKSSLIDETSPNLVTLLWSYTNYY